VVWAILSMKTFSLVLTLLSLLVGSASASSAGGSPMTATGVSKRHVALRSNDKNMLRHRSRDEEDATPLTASVPVQDKTVGLRVAAEARGGSDESSTGLLHNMKVTFYFALWYALNVVYNSKFH
jgi:hypothetical protein